MVLKNTAVSDRLYNIIYDVYAQRGGNHQIIIITITLKLNIYYCLI
jgi:hypothetical protein